jgi:malic enzyme
MSESTLYEDALHYHRREPSGKLAIQASKPLATQCDLALAYSPGVATACQAIQTDPLQAAQLTACSNLVAVVTNGTAVLGLGAIGPLAAKPVMEGKAVLFKKFAGIDAFDPELKVLAKGVSVGPMLFGMAKPVHILSSSVTTRGTLNMSVMTVVDALAHRRREEPGRVES